MSKSMQRTVRSFVRRAGRITPGQQRALDTLWPRYGLEFEPQVADPASWFANARPLTLEIGFGNGDSLLEIARTHPDRNFLGIEVHRPGVGKLLMSLEQAGIDNVRIICHDAVEVLQQQIPDGSLDRVLVFFPDPWPKKRHHKRRLIQPEFVSLLARKLHRGGRLHMATDWENYAEHMLEVMQASPEFENSRAGGGFSQRPSDRPLTKFEQRGQRLGHGTWDLVFIKK
jgi:tRNA (guanine-N7-)-methyltransferase